MKNISLVLLLALFSVMKISAQSRVAPAEETSSAALIAIMVIGLLVAGAGVIGFIGVLIWYLMKKK